MRQSECSLRFIRLVRFGFVPGHSDLLLDCKEGFAREAGPSS